MKELQRVTRETAEAHPRGVRIWLGGGLEGCAYALAPDGMTPAERAVIEAAEQVYAEHRNSSPPQRLLNKAVEALMAERAPKPRYVCRGDYGNRCIYDTLTEVAVCVGFVTADLTLERICRLLNEEKP